MVQRVHRLSRDAPKKRTSQTRNNILASTSECNDSDYTSNMETHSSGIEVVNMKCLKNPGVVIPAIDAFEDATMKNPSRDLDVRQCVKGDGFQILVLRGLDLNVGTTQEAY